MVVRLTTGRHLAGAVRYNERKVAEGMARQLAAGHYGHEGLAFASQPYKIRLLEALAARNPRMGKPCLHVALAFHPTEQLSDERLRQISREFLEALGYGGQPYLLYRHEDTAHPHVHLVSVSVDLDGRRIGDSHLRRRASRIRRALEQRHGLVVAEHQRHGTRRPLPEAALHTGTSEAPSLRVFRLAMELRRQGAGSETGPALVRELVEQHGVPPHEAERAVGLLARQERRRGAKTPVHARPEPAEPQPEPALIRSPPTRYPRGPQH